MRKCWRAIRSPVRFTPYGYTPESYYPGSEYVPEKKLPNGQFEVLGTVREGDDYELSGMGFRAGKWLVTAWHVIEPLQEVMLSNGEKTVKIDRDAFFEMENDVAACLYTSALEKLGLAKLRLTTPGTGKYDMQYVAIVGKKPYQKTIGCLKASRSMYYVNYEGSTTHTFSGAPYINGKSIYGMHVGSHSTNIGVDASYIETLLSLRDESYPWESLLTHGRRYEYRETQDGNMIARTKHGYKAMSKDLKDQYLAGLAEEIDETEEKYQAVASSAQDFVERLHSQGKKSWAYDYESKDWAIKQGVEMLEHVDNEPALNSQRAPQPSEVAPVIASSCQSTGSLSIAESNAEDQKLTPLLEILKSIPRTLHEDQTKALTAHLESILAQSKDLSANMRRSLKTSVRFLKSLPTNGDGKSSIKS